MAMRLTGLMSGMDTETMISQLVSARKTKVDDAKKAQKKLEWKQDAWKTLNTKVRKLFDGALGNMRFESSFMKKTTKVSNSNVVSVITGEGAMNSVQSLEVEELAKSAYLTGATVGNGKGGYDKDTTLGRLGITEEQSFQITVGEGENAQTKEITVNRATTIGELVSQLNDAGVTASFDTKNQRFYIASKETGLENDFKITAVKDDAGNTDGSEGLIKALGLSEADGAHKDAASDAKIKLNGVEYTSSRNSFEVNGLTLTVNAKTDGDPVTITTQDDTDGIYDMVKNFFKEYNELINEMDKLYNADSARGYEPLTSEEKESMTEEEIEEWEKKVKGALLRRDGTLGTLSSTIKKIMTAGVDVNGTKMYLSNFGIETLSYFTAADNEKNAYHIDGDSDDVNTSGNEDKLRSMIASDPDTVVSFFTSLSKELYGEMQDLMAGTEFSSAYTVYEDKKMKEEYDEYTSKIKDLEKKLTAYEDQWYAKFAAMESAMAKMQQNASAVTSLLGGGM